MNFYLQLMTLKSHPTTNWVEMKAWTYLQNFRKAEMRPAIPKRICTCQNRQSVGISLAISRDLSTWEISESIMIPRDSLWCLRVRQAPLPGPITEGQEVTFSSNPMDRYALSQLRLGYMDFMKIPLRLPRLKRIQ